MKITEIRKAYSDNTISKKEYMNLMMEHHAELMQYSSLLEGDSIVKNISIDKNGVILSIEDELTNGKIVKISLSSEQDAECFSVSAIDFGAVENQECKMFKRVCDVLKPQSFFDIGANEGWYSIHMAVYDPLVKIYAFEPARPTFERARNNFSINALDTSSIYNIGLSDEIKHASVFFNPSESGATSLQNIREIDDGSLLDIELDTMDNFVIKNCVENIDFVKIDIEGNELFAIKGGIDSIKRFRPVIFCEMLRKWSSKFGYHPNDIMDLLANIGYECYLITEDNRLERLDRMTDDIQQTNFFFMCPDKHGEIIRALS